MPRKSIYEVKASLLISESVSRGSLFHVIASAKPEKPVVELAGFGCTSCGAEFAAIKGSEPFCVVCSADSDYVENLDTDGSLEIEDIEESELASVCCNSCNTHLIISMEAAKVFDTKMSCITCGTDVEYELDFEEVENDDAEEAEFEDEGVFVDDEELADLSVDEIIEVDEVDEEEDDSGDIILPEETSANSPHDKPGNENNDSDDVNKNPPIDETKFIEKEVMPGKTKFDDTETSNVDEEDEDVDVELEEVDLMDTVEGGLSIARHEDVIVAYRGPVPVATLKEENAGQNKPVFRSSGFSKAIITLASTEGPSALANLGFESVKIKVPLKTVLENKVSAKVEVAKAKFEEQAKTFQEDMEQCLGLALAGMNKGFFKGKNNVLKNAFINELAAAGIRNPAKVVDKVFAGYSEEFSKNLLEKAFELSSKSLETRNELAEAIGDSEFISDPVEDDEEFSEEVTVARLARGGKPKVVAKESASINLASNSVSEIIEQARLSGTSIFKRY